MARINNLTNFLNDVATAIKTKLGDNTPIPASQFDTKIGEIETGGTYQSKTINVTTNGSQTITPDTGYDALSSVLINVQVPIPSLQTKNYEFTQNTHIVLSPEQGYDGFSSIDLTINVPGSQPVLETKNITQNGTYTPSQGYDGIGQAIVNVKSPIKLYSSKQEMMADINEPENEYGVVYYSNIINVTPSIEISELSILNTVELDTAVTSRINCRSTDRHLSITITSSSCSITYYGEETSARVSYTSSDGITYTKSSGDNSIILDEPTYMSTNGWNDVIGQFLLIGGMYFEGMYEWKNEVDEEYWDVLTDFTLTNTPDIVPIQEERYLPLLQLTVDKILEDGAFIRGWTVQLTDGYYYYICNNWDYDLYIDNNKNYYMNTNGNNIINMYKLNLDDGTYTLINTISSTDKYVMINNISAIVCTHYSSYNTDINIRLLNADKSSYTSLPTSINVVQSFLTWHHVKTEFTLESPGELLPGVTALGKHGPVTGTNAIFDLLPVDNIMSDIYGLTKIQNGSMISYFTNNSAYISKKLNHRLHYYKYSTTVSNTTLLRSDTYLHKILKQNITLPSNTVYCSRPIISNVNKTKFLICAYENSGNTRENNYFYFVDKNGTILNQITIRVSSEGGAYSSYASTNISKVYGEGYGNKVCICGNNWAPDLFAVDFDNEQIVQWMHGYSSQSWSIPCYLNAYDTGNHLLIASSYRNHYDILSFDGTTFTKLYTETFTSEPYADGIGALVASDGTDTYWITDLQAYSSSNLYRMAIIKISNLTETVTFVKSVAEYHPNLLPYGYTIIDNNCEITNSNVISPLTRLDISLNDNNIPSNIDITVNGEPYTNFVYTDNVIAVCDYTICNVNNLSVTKTNNIFNITLNNPIMLDFVDLLATYHTFRYDTNQIYGTKINIPSLLGNILYNNGTYYYYNSPSYLTEYELKYLTQSTSMDYDVCLTNSNVDTYVCTCCITDVQNN